MMHAPVGSLKLSLAAAAARQTNAAIAAFEQGMFDVALTLAGAAEGMIERDGPHLFQWLRQHPGARERFSKAEWISGLNMERDWLKHGGAAEITIERASAAFMIARAMSKLDQWSPAMDEFKIWLLSNLDDLSRFWRSDFGNCERRRDFRRSLRIGVVMKDGRVAIVAAVILASACADMAKAEPARQGRQYLGSP